MDPASGLCRGCYRTLAEIADWGQADDATRLLVLARVDKRRQDYDPSGAELRGECER
jgi:predicted Fe-S protein YdhL (DUF1289 family)